MLLSEKVAPLQVGGVSAGRGLTARRRRHPLWALQLNEETLENQDNLVPSIPCLLHIQLMNDSVEALWNEINVDIHLTTYAKIHSKFFIDKFKLQTIQILEEN